MSEGEWERERERNTEEENVRKKEMKSEREEYSGRVHQIFRYGNIHTETGRARQGK